MGTRGAFGVRIDGQDKVMYNHFDSYPEGLGSKLATQLADMLSRPAGLDGIRAAAREVLVVPDDDSEATLKKITERLGERFRDKGVSTGDNAYAYVRGLQGDLRSILDTAHVMLDGHGFLEDSLFCEWAYVANLDDGTLEVYRGFQKKPHSDGRYAPLETFRKRREESGRPSEHYPVALVAALSLDSALPHALGEIAQRIAKEEEEDE